MSDRSSNDDQFIDKAEALIVENLSNEQFGVSELAGAMNMSRSNLLRKIKKQTRLSASQFIRRVRLEKGMEKLAETSLTVSEVAFNVGFASASYFIKCFKDYYGYPPGEVGRRSRDDNSGDLSTTRQRQLAAIMFTDIQGYTSLMQQDESKAIAFRERHREVFDSTTKKFHGRILQYYGDGTLSTFPSAIHAVQCGIEMQLAFLKETPQIPIRIGIHSGDIIVTDEEIIGDGVNVAARIESLATTGSIYISDKVYDEIKNQPELLTESRGVHKLKNVTKPVEVYAVFDQELGALNTPLKRVPEKAATKNSNAKWTVVTAAALLLAIFAYSAGLFSWESNPNQVKTITDKSIAVLPFKNESSDSSNLYFVNGLMESTLSKLQKIKDLRVISRSSVERYRQTEKTIPQLADELKVKYFVAGSGQKIGDRVLLNIQLIEASSDRQIWASQYSSRVVDIFELQNEVARKIVGSIEAIVTPAELDLIEKKPTENLLAYDYYLQAMDPYSTRTPEGLEEAIGLFEKAIQEDPEFALAYANIVISYYLIEMSQADKHFTEQINSYADKAMLYDPKAAESLIAKAIYYIQTNDYQLALPHLEKALEYNPNSYLAVHFLADFHYRLLPNSGKYLEYALKGVQLNLASDSVTQSYIYLQLANALVENGFIDEAITYVDKSLTYYAENYYAPHLKAFIMFAKDGNVVRTRNLVLAEWNKDTSRLDLLQDVAKLYYLEENYDSAYFYFNKFVTARENQGLAIYVMENAKIAFVYKKMGLDIQAEELFRDFSDYCEEDHSSSRSAKLAAKYAYEGKVDQAIEQLHIFSEVDDYQYWYLLLEDEPVLKAIKDHPDFEGIVQKIKDRFWESKARLREELEADGLI